MAVSILEFFSQLHLITRVNYAIFFFLIFVTILAVAIILGGRKPQLRRLPLLYSVDEMVSSAAERGRPIVYYFGLGNQMSTGGINDVNNWLQVVRYTARRTGELETHTHGIGRDPMSYMYLSDYVRQGYMESPHPELFVPHNFYQVPGGISESGADSVELMDIVNRRGCGGLFLYGTMGDSYRLYMAAETAAVQGALTMNISNGGWATCFGGVLADFNSMSDQYLAMGAYLQDDPKITATLVGKDIVKLGLVVWVIGLIILTFAGVV
jgi:hypothetical protein